MNTLKTCSNLDCPQDNPQPANEFLPGRSQCRTCFYTKQRKYKARNIGKVRKINRKANRRYRAAGKDRKDKARWLKYNQVVKDALQEGGLFKACETCVENADGQGGNTCHVAHGAEDISVCLVYQEWQQSGEHPLPDPAKWVDDYYDQDQA